MGLDVSLMALCMHYGPSLTTLDIFLNNIFISSTETTGRTSKCEELIIIIIMSLV